jgi:hypothetical protein
MLSAKDIREFRGFLRNATDRQVQGIYDKEKGAGRDDYAELAVVEAERRGIDLDTRTRYGATKKKSAAQLDREINEALNGGGSGSGGVKLAYDDPEIEKMFKKRGDTDKNVTAILGDAAYTKRFKMPKWNIKPTMLQTPDVAIRHWSELGIPRSKGAHAQRADYFRDLRRRFDAEHQRLLGEGARAYGKEGALISGGFREDWPTPLKDRIRFVAQGSTILGDAVQLHEALSKTRSPVFQW